MFVDGMRAGSVRNGSSVDIEVTGGVHAMQLRMGWLRSPNFQVLVEQGDTVTVTAWMKVGSLVDILLTPGNVIQMRLAPSTQSGP